MGKRGRKSIAEQTIAVIGGNLDARPEAPGELTAEQMEIWNKTVSTEPPNYFATAAARGILADYCRHRHEAERLAKVIDAFDMEWLQTDEGVKRYELLAKMRDRETKGALMCATKLRITNQSRYTPLSAATAARNSTKQAVKPWETEK